MVRSHSTVTGIAPAEPYSSTPRAASSVVVSIRVGPKDCKRQSFCVTRLGLQNASYHDNQVQCCPVQSGIPWGWVATPWGKRVLLHGEVCFTESQPLGWRGESPGQRNWSIDWGEEGWGWGKSQDSPRRAWAMAVHWFKQTACVHGTPG